MTYNQVITHCKKIVGNAKLEILLLHCVLAITFYIIKKSETRNPYNYACEFITVQCHSIVV